MSTIIPHIIVIVTAGTFTRWMATRRRRQLEQWNSGEKVNDALAEAVRIREEGVSWGQGLRRLKRLGVPQEAAIPLMKSVGLSPSWRDRAVVLVVFAAFLSALAYLVFRE